MPMSEIHANEYDIIIAGAGMVGASLACLLAKAPLRIAIIDRQPLRSAGAGAQFSGERFDPRVSAISQASQQLFRDLDIWDDITARRVCDYQDMLVWDAEGTGSISFSAAQIKQSELGSIVENSVILDALHSRVAQLENTVSITPFSIDSLDYEEGEGEDERRVVLTADDGQTLRAPLVIAADGANSKIRQLTNFECREWDYEQQALVTTVRTERGHGNTAMQRFLETGPLAFLPLRLSSQDSELHYCSIVWTMLPDQAERVMALSEESFNAELGAAIEFKLGKILASDRRFVFPLRQRHAVDYVKQGIALVGDAAHTIHPLAGQGVNLGLLDARALAQELSRGVAAGRSVADITVLQRYQRRRKGNNLSMMWLMEGFKRLFAQQDLGIRWLRNIGMNAADKMTPIKNQMMRRAMGLDS